VSKYLALVGCLASVSVARADGVYFSQAVGASSSDEPSVGRAMYTRASVGVRYRFLALEPWITSDTQLDREGAFRGFIGGDPAPGRSDLAHYGLALKAMLPLQQTKDLAVEGYVRAGASLVSATGALDGYGGYGIGAGYGFQLRGRVRALGFLWGPLFFMKRGPKVTAALFVEHGRDIVRMEMSGARLATHVDHLSMGFGVGSSF
jgi:hypothetical protein